MPPKHRRAAPVLPPDYRALVQKSAGALFWLRVSAGIAGWLLFSQIRSGQGSAHPALLGLTEAVFWLYLAGNGFAYVRYRHGHFGKRTLLADAGLNLGALLWLAATTGGLTSPVMALVFVTIAVYGLLFGLAAGVGAAVATSIALAIFLAGGGWLGFHPLVQPVELPSLIDAHIAYFGVFGVSLVGFCWLLVQLGRREVQSQADAERARHAAERERRALATTNALLRMNQALGQLANPNEVLEKVVTVGCELLQASTGSAFSWSEETQTYKAEAIAGVPAAERERFLAVQLPAASVPDLEWVRSFGHCVVLGAPIAHSGQGARERALVAPVKVDQHFFGVLQFVRGDERPFTQYHIRLLDGMANQVALVLERARLVEQSYRLLRAIESTEEGVLLLDVQGRIRFANPAFTRLFGYAWNELGGRPATELAAPPPEGWGPVVRTLATEHHWRGELHVLHRDGGTVPVRLHANTIVDSQGVAEGVVAILEDVRAEKAMEEQLLRANRLAAAGEIAAGLVHEWNNALTVILGQTALARDCEDRFALQQALLRVEHQAQRMAQLAQEVLGFARPAAPRLESVRANELIRGAAAMLAPECARRSIELVCEESSEALVVRADPVQAQQILLNLLSNAIQALEGSSSGRIVLRVCRGDAMHAIEVEDNGPGIPAELLTRIFDPFVTTKPKGTGLGLAISYAIARAHGGCLTVRSALGEGAVFRWELPAAGTAEESRTAARNPRIPWQALVVDDDPAVANALVAMLQEEGARVERACSGEEALEKCSREDWDAVFLDVRLPDLSGPEVYATLQRQRPALARRVVFVTGGLWRASAWARPSPLPSQPTLAKPCTREQLQSVLAALEQLRAAA